MRNTTKVVMASLGLAAVVAVPALASSEEDALERETPITGSQLEQASSAALSHLGEGRVTDTEAGDEESYYEVEVTLEDGSQLDVQLDREFNVVGTESESEGSSNDD